MRLLHSSLLVFAAATSLLAPLLPSCVPSFPGVQPGADGGLDAKSDGQPHDATPETLPMDAGGGTETGADAESGAPDSGPLPAQIDTLLNGLGVATESGTAQQQHLIYATNSGRYWLFYYDSEATSLKTQWSFDLVTWTASTTLTLPMTNSSEGRDLAVAYMAFGANDIVHIATALDDGTNERVYETRGAITGSAIAFGSPSLVHDLNDALGIDAGGVTHCQEPDGTSVAIGADGRVYVGTSWVDTTNGSCDSNVFASTGMESGTSGPGTFPNDTYQHWQVPIGSQAHQLVAMSTGNMLAAWDSANGQPPTDVSFGAEQSGAWNQSSTEIFPESPGEDPNDWSVCRVDDNDVYAIRRHQLAATTDGGPLGPSTMFDHYIWSGGGFTYVASLPNDEGALGTGVVLLTNGTSLLAAAISDDTVGHVRYTTFSNGTWAAWADVPGQMFAAQRAWLSGSGCQIPAHPVLLWTEGATPPYTLKAMPVSALFP